MYEQLKEIVRQIPDNPGVYLMKNGEGKVIYVGKAKNLKKRTSSYFTGDRGIKTRALVSHIANLEYIITKNEYEALLLENNLIKEMKPRYNINLKDGKTYPVIRITNEEFPRVFRTRRVIKDGSDYYGPFPMAGKLDMYLELIKKHFPLRKCRGHLKMRDKPCLYYHIGKCEAPCSGKINKDEYGEKIKRVKKLLSGSTKELISSLRNEMTTAAENLDFEFAASLRDTLVSIETAGNEQKVVDFNPEDRDYIGCSIKEHLCTFTVMQMRDGKMTGRDLYRTEIHSSEEEIFLDFLLLYYSGGRTPPLKMYLSFQFDPELITDYFRNEKSWKVKILFPVKGKHMAIMNMALENGQLDVVKRLRSISNIPALEELQLVLSLPSLPVRIEGFDISQLDGKYPVSSLVSFYNGNPDKKNYRYFHIKTLNGEIDDYKAIREAVARRYTRIINENLEKPDLVVIDGGKGQVNAAKGILDAIGLNEVPVIGLAKKFEEIFLPGNGDSVILPEGAAALKILQSVRDETHRFATSFNRKLREKDAKFSLLEKIPGIGPSRSKKLLKTFGSIAKIKENTAAEVAEKCGLPAKDAEKVLEYLQMLTVQKPGKL